MPHDKRQFGNIIRNIESFKTLIETHMGILLCGKFKQNAAAATLYYLFCVTHIHFHIVG